jgi:hypothetical protein
MFNFKNKRFITVTSFILALVLTAGVAYAALSGVLTIQGNVTLDGDLKLEFMFFGPAPPGAEVSDCGQILTINDGFTLDKPGSFEYFDIGIVNTGSIDAKIIAINTTEDAPIILGGTLFDFVDAVITVDEFLVEAIFTVQWDADDAYAHLNAGETKSFKITLDYVPN